MMQFTNTTKIACLGIFICHLMYRDRLQDKKQGDPRFIHFITFPILCEFIKLFHLCFKVFSVDTSMLPIDVGRMKIENGDGDFLREKCVVDVFGERETRFFQEMGT